MATPHRPENATTTCRFTLIAPVPVRTRFTLIELVPVRTRFTLIELLVVVAIIAVLAAMLLPALGKARDRAFQATCMSNQKQVAVAFTMYAGDEGDHIPMQGNYSSPFGTKYWYTHYTGSDSRGVESGDYIQDETVLRCTKNTAGYYGTYWTQNTFKRVEATYQTTVVHKDSSATTTFLYRYTRLPAVTEADNYMILGCTSVSKLTRANPPYTMGSPNFVNTQFWTGGSWDQQGIWMAHGTANGLFADMHVEACNGGRLEATINHQRTDTGLDGGIRAYKLKSGIALKDGVVQP